MAFIVMLIVVIFMDGVVLGYALSTNNTPAIVFSSTGALFCIVSLLGLIDK